MPFKGAAISRRQMEEKAKGKLPMISSCQHDSALVMLLKK
jgi:hypothetical protein